LSLPESVSDLIGVPQYCLQAEASVSESNVRAMCAVVENGNPRYWPPQQAPSSMLSTWSRPELWSPDGEEQLKALQLHYDLKQVLGFPTAIVSSFESIFHAPVLIGDLISSQQILLSVSDEKNTRLGRGRFWEIEVQYHNQRDELAGLEQFSCLGYRRVSTDA
jgi:hypothetical protein